MVSLEKTSAVSAGHAARGVNPARFECYTPLQQAIELLKRLEKRSCSIEKLAAELGIEENFISHFVRLLQGMQWIKSDNRELWSITEKGDVWLHDIQNTLEEENHTNNSPSWYAQ
ncbi:MAG TPA: hypothetical protein VNI77_05020 [Nitrososphaera sp.]|nr:hypothetical protein [Nitrososphaera sp.]